MTTIAADAAKLRELDRDTSRAWSEYRERTRALTGDAYDSAEHEAWAELQGELIRLDRRRKLMTPHSD